MREIRSLVTFSIFRRFGGIGYLFGYVDTRKSFSATLFNFVNISPTQDREMSQQKISKIQNLIFFLTFCLIKIKNFPSTVQKTKQIKNNTHTHNMNLKMMRLTGSPPSGLLPLKGRGLPRAVSVESTNTLSTSPSSSQQDDGSIVVRGDQQKPSPSVLNRSGSWNQFPSPPQGVNSVASSRQSIHSQKIVEYPGANGK